MEFVKNTAINDILLIHFDNDVRNIVCLVQWWKVKNTI